MLVRRLLAVAVAGVVALAMTACGPAVVTPTPTPTEVTQEEAYAQAEDAYRAYIDAINSITVDDSATLQAAYARSTGRQNSFDRKEFSSWQAQHWTVSGELVVLWVDAVAYDEDSDAVQLEACLDSTRVQVLDPDGNSRKQPDAIDVRVWNVNVLELNDDGDWRVEATTFPEGAETCQER